MLWPTDNLKDMARRTQEDDDWKAYRQARNDCTKRQKNDRKDYLEKTYKKLEDENDSGKVFSLTRQLLGWTRSGPPTMLKQGTTIYRKQNDPPPPCEF